MRILCDYQTYTEDEIKKLVISSKPFENTNLKIEKGEEKYGWVNLYFSQNDKNFSIISSLAVSDLSYLVIFFENIINLKDEIAIIIDDECISEPLLYAKAKDEANIRFLVADGKSIHDKWKAGKLNYEPQLSQYEIVCDVIVNKKKFLKDFYLAVKNIIKMYKKNEIYCLGYNNWKKNLKHIKSYIN